MVSMKKPRSLAIRIAGLVAALVLVALLVFTGLALFRTGYSEHEIGQAEPGDALEPDQDFTVSIVGDISLADNWKIMPQYDSRGKGVSGILSDEILNFMR